MRSPRRITIQIFIARIALASNRNEMGNQDENDFALLELIQALDIQNEILLERVT